MLFQLDSISINIIYVNKILDNVTVAYYRQEKIYYEHLWF